MNMIQQQQQHRHETKKIVSEQGENGCPEKKGKADHEVGEEEESKAAKQSSTQVTTQLTVATHSHTRSISPRIIHLC